MTDGLYLSTDAPQNDVTITTIRFMDYAKTLNQEMHILRLFMVIISMEYWSIEM